MNGCDWNVNPFDLGDEDEGRCGKEPAPEATFRRKSDGFEKVGRRCVEHTGLCNDRWEVVPPSV